MSEEVRIIIAGYVFLIIIITFILAFPVLTDIIVELLKEWDKWKKKRKKDENHRRKSL